MTNPVPLTIERNLYFLPAGFSIMVTGPPSDGIGDDEKGVGHDTSILEALQDGVFVIDPDGTITYVNKTLAALAGRERNDLIGASFDALFDSDLFRSEAYDRFEDSITALAEGGVHGTNLTIETARGPGSVLDIRLSERTREDGARDIIAVARDVTERERTLEAAERKRKALRQLYETGADASLTFDEKVEQILALGCEYLDLPYGFLTTIEGNVQRMVHTVGDHELLQPGESAPLEESYCRKTVQSDDLVGMQDASTELGEDDAAYERFGLGCYVGAKILVGEDLYGTFCFAASTTRDREFSTDEREVVKLLGQWAGYELERQRFEKRLRGLHQISQRLLVAETADEVARIAVETGRDLFDLPVTACWQYDPAADVLRPLAATEECLQLIGEMPIFEGDRALVWESFESGEIRSYENVAEEADVYNPETDIRSEVHVPFGDHGVIISAASEPRAFDEIDIESLRLLGALLDEAMTAVEREEMLIERGEALQRQNERLEEFTNLVAHDLRNPLSGAVGALELAREMDDAHFYDRVEQSLQRMDELIGELLDIARGDREGVNARTLSLESIVEEAWSYNTAQNATLSIEDDLGQINADETRLLQLFGNLFRNSIEHAGEDVTVRVGLLHEGDGFFVADDGPGLSEDSRIAFEEFGQVGSTTRAGIGLASVTDIVDAHGWNLSIPDTKGGARFEIRTDGTAE
ncbi:MAG: GAF domain-containing protein [Halodesulfurarchaeum sp.]